MDKFDIIFVAIIATLAMAFEVVMVVDIYTPKTPHSEVTDIVEPD